MVLYAKLWLVFGKKKGETFGSFYHFLSTTKQGAINQARKKYKLKVLSISLERKKKIL